MEEQKSEIVSEKEIYCSGEGGVLGHPKIYLEIGEKNEIDCPYCGKKFIFAPVKIK